MYCRGVILRGVRQWSSIMALFLVEKLHVVSLSWCYSSMTPHQISLAKSLCMAYLIPPIFSLASLTNMIDHLPTAYQAVENTFCCISLDRGKRPILWLIQVLPIVIMHISFLIKKCVWCLIFKFWIRYTIILIFVIRCYSLVVAPTQGTFQHHDFGVLLDNYLWY